MESETFGFTEHYADAVADRAGDRVWRIFTTLRREKVSVAGRIDDVEFWKRVTRLAADVGAMPMLVVSRHAEGRALSHLIYGMRTSPNNLTIERKDRREMGNSYIGTVESVDVFGADFPPGTAWLFSPYILQTVKYAQLGADEHVLRVTFEPGEDLKGSLIAEFQQSVAWADWPIYDVSFEDPEESD
jgi:hypothetical protein